MNILVVSQYFWPENFRINDLCSELQKKGHLVTVLTGMPNYPEGKIFPGYRCLQFKEEVMEGIRIIRAPLISRGDATSFRLIINYLSFAMSASLLSLIKDLKNTDVILVYEPSPITVGIPAIITKLITNRPILFWVQDLWPETLKAVGAVKSRPVLSMIETLVRFIYNRCDVILVQSRSFIQSVKLHCTRRPRIEYYPNSTESFYRPVMLEENAPEKSLVPEGFIIMFAGNIGVAQDFETILEAADLTKHLPQIKWVIVGDGRQKEWVHSEVTRRKLENTVHLLGRYRAEQMPRFFSLADALLVTLKRDPVFALTIPSKVQSYLACARPIIAALDGEGARIVDESGVGISCPAESPLELADAVMRMYRTSREDRVEMGLKGRDYYEKHFDRDLLVNRLEDIMKDALRENTI